MSSSRLFREPRRSARSGSRKQQRRLRRRCVGQGRRRRRSRHAAGHAGDRQGVDGRAGHLGGYCRRGAAEARRQGFQGRASSLAWKPARRQNASAQPPQRCAAPHRRSQSISKRPEARPAGRPGGDAEREQRCACRAHRAQGDRRAHLLQPATARAPAGARSESAGDTVRMPDTRPDAAQPGGGRFQPLDATAGAWGRPWRLHGRVPRRGPRHAGHARRALVDPRRRLSECRLHSLQGAAACGARSSKKPRR